MRKLLDVASIKAGHPFRGAIACCDGGNAHVIQIKNIVEGGEILWDELIKTNLTGRNPPNWLQQGDVIFSARGMKNIAGYVGKAKHPTVCAQHYYILQVKGSTILPEFLAWQLNQYPVQHYLTKSAQGSSQLSVPKTLLGNAPIYVLPIKQQKIIIKINNKLIKEKKVLNGLIHNRTRQMQAIAQKVLSASPDRKSK
jgi:restriction endonuclease S subunit